MEQSLVDLSINTYQPGSEQQNFCGNNFDFFTSAWSREEVEEATADDWSKTIFNLSPVEGQPRLLVCWVVGEAALVTDRLEVIVDKLRL